MFCAVLVLLAILGTLSVTSGYLVASDDSGKYLYAASATYGIQISQDYGSTWNQTGSPGTYWSASSDSSGKNLMTTAICNGNCVAPLMSHDGGITWKASASAPNDNYFGGASDGTGKHLVAAGTNDLYVSNDGGSTWRGAGMAGFQGTAVAYSADGSKFIYSYKNYISMHVNGIYEETPSPEAHWISLSTDATGKVIAGAYDIGYYPNAGQTKAIHLSLDGGFSYSTLVTNTGATTYSTVLVTDDASLVFYATTAGVYQYNLAKKTTTKANYTSGGTALAASKTGKYVVVSSSTNIWVSSDYGINFKLVK